MQSHEWRERTDEGELRLVRARHHGGRWRLQSRLRSAEGWSDHEPPLLEDLLALRDVLDRKYRRGRVPHELRAEVDALIEAAGGVPPDADRG